MSPDDLDKARERLISSSDYKRMLERLDGNNPFADLDGSSSRGISEEEEKAQSSFVLRQVARAAIDVAVALVPVALVVTFAKFPPPVVEILGSAATAIRATPIEPVRAQGGGGGNGHTADDKHYLCEKYSRTGFDQIWVISLRLCSVSRPMGDLNCTVASSLLVVAQGDHCYVCRTRHLVCSAYLFKANASFPTRLSWPQGHGNDGGDAFARLV